MKRSLWLAWLGPLAASLLSAEQPRFLHRLEGHTKTVLSVAFSPDGETLASGSDERAVRLWTVATGQSIAKLEPEGECDRGYPLSFSPDGKTLASACDRGMLDHGINLWDITTRRNKARIDGGGNHCQSIVFTPDGKTMLSVWRGCGDWILLSDVATAKRRAKFDLVDPWIGPVAFSPDRKCVAWATWDSLDDPHPAARTDRVIERPDGETTTYRLLYTIKVYELEGAQKDLATFEGHGGQVSSLAFSPDGKTLASGIGFPAKTIKFWDLDTGKCIAILRQQEGYVGRVVFSPDGKMLASVGGQGQRTVKLWDVAKHTIRANLEGHTDFVTSLAFSPDGKILASGSADKTIRLWGVK